MKKCVLVLVFFVAVSCHHIYDPEPEPDPVVPAEVTFLDCFVGHKWVYDHPDIPTWEEWNVFDDGVMYYSNSTSFVYQFTNTDVKCRYTYNYENGSFLVQTEKLGVIEGIISQWDEYAFSWKTMDGTFEYGRVLESVNIINGSAYLPSYSTLVSDATISAFSSHNNSIATVDGNGKITALNQGRTYIDVVTDKGTALIEVNVEGLFNVDYSAMLNVAEALVIEQFGAPDTIGDGKMVYLYDNGNFSKVVFELNENDVVRRIVLTLADNSRCFVSDNDVTACLSDSYFKDSSASTSSEIVYTNAENPEDVTVTVYWNKADRIIAFEYEFPLEAIIADYEKKNGEYSCLLGKPKSDIEASLGNDAFYVTATDLWYLGESIRAKDYQYVAFTLDEPTTRAYAIGLFLNENPDYEEIKDYLEAKYTMYENGSSSNQLAFINAKDIAHASMGITVDLVNGLITFVDLSYKYGGTGYDNSTPHCAAIVDDSAAHIYFPDVIELQKHAEQPLIKQNDQCK